MTTKRAGYVLVSSHYAPLYQYGGPVRLAVQYASLAQREGLDVCVVTMATEAELAEARDSKCAEGAVSSDVSALALDRRSVWARLKAIPAAFRMTWRQSARSSDTLLHICEYRAPLTLGATLALAVRCKARRWLTALTPVSEAEVKAAIVHSAFGQLQPANHVAKRGYDAIFRGLTRSLPYTVLVQNTHEDSIARAFFRNHSKLRVTLLPLTTAGWDQLPEQAAPAAVVEQRMLARTAFGLPTSSAAIQRPVLVFLGRWVPAKGIERLLKAVAALPSDLEPTLIVAGADFGIGDQLRQLAESLGLTHRVRFEENVSARRFSIYAAADVFTAFPTLYEETMLASIEALSVGTPILVSQEADVPYVQDAGAGFIIDFSQQAFESALRRLIADPEASPKARKAWARWFTPAAQDATLRAVLRG